MTNQTPDHSNNAPHHVAALYHFAPLNNREDVREALLDLCMAKGVLGTILLAEEGVNGTISGSEDALAAILAHIRSWSGFAETEAKYSIASEAPFLRMKVRLKREIVSMGVEGVDAAHDKGEYLAPHEWNAALDDPDTVVIDTRNSYEVAIGSFDGAIDPATTSFREFPAWFDDFASKLRASDEATPKRIAMFCTGGIRCEKATAYVRAQGFADVVHLKGGILKYLEHVPPAHSKFDGECFVFDERVSVGQGLKPGDYTLCRACRMPLAPEELAHPDYIEGEQCPHCADVRTEAQKTRYRERQRQMELAAERGAEHLAPQKTPSD
jgi:UPF0176 protein